MVFVKEDVAVQDMGKPEVEDMKILVVLEQILLLEELVLAVVQDVPADVESLVQLFAQ